MRALLIDLKPFVKWAGGKRKETQILENLIPDNYNFYVEPFVGSGALFLHHRPKNALINDVNTDLINAYRTIKDEPSKLIEYLTKHKKKHDKEYYYKIREKFNELRSLEALLSNNVNTYRASLFIYLNKTCFNGLWRVNQKDEFNTPMGDYKNPSIIDEDNILNLSEYFNKDNIQFYSLDYQEFLNKFTNSGDFIYFYPPFHPIAGYTDFKRYTKNQFREEDQRILSIIFRNLSKKAFVVLSNSAAPLVRELYNDFEFDVFNALRSISSDGGKRGAKEELIFYSPNIKINDPLFHVRKFPSTRYMGSKEKIIEQIYEALKDLEFTSVLDAFSGSGIVSYLFKSMGKKVTSNDFLSFSSTISKAVIENNREILTDHDIQTVLVTNPNPYTKISETFQGLYFSDEDNKFLDNIWTNIDQNIINEYKRALILSSLARACYKKRPRGIFTYVGLDKYNDNRRDLKLSLKEHFLEAINNFNRTVLMNNKINCSESIEIVKNDISGEFDLVYLDPPYFTLNSDNNYSRRYHFIEGLMTYWRDPRTKIDFNTKTKKFKNIKSAFNNKSEVYAAFDTLIDKFKNSIIVISYSSNSLPTLEELKYKLRTIGEKKDIYHYAIPYKYSIGTQRKDISANAVHEYLIIGKN